MPLDHETFLKIAEILAEKSTCERGNVGALIVKDRRIISMGYNGAPPGLPHCTEVGCEVLRVAEVVDNQRAVGYGRYGSEVELGCQRCVHAEANAVAYAARRGLPTDSAIMYCTHSPCRKCAELMASSGITAVYYRKEYRETPWVLLTQMGIKEYKVVDGAFAFRVKEG